MTFQTSTFSSTTLAKDKLEIADNIKDGHKSTMSDHNDALDGTLIIQETSQTLFYANECEPSPIDGKSGEHIGCDGEWEDPPLDYNGVE